MPLPIVPAYGITSARPLTLLPISIQTLTDPPENVLINTGSDKLNLVEGSNGPRLSCEASGEPQVQYRWLLLKANGSSDLLDETGVDALTLAKRNERGQTSLSPSGAGERTINQLASKALDASLLSAGFNDGSALVELAASTTDQVGGVSGLSVSTLDLSKLSVDRRQSGHYICEAANKLGQTRQAVYVNVLCK